MMPRHTTRRGFSLAEALMGMTLLALAASVILLAVDSSMQTADDSVDRAIAAGLARQIVDEVMGTRYAAAGAGPQQTPLSASGWELAGQGRERFDDTDDFVGYISQPADNRWGQSWGRGDGSGGLRHADFRVRDDYFDRWRQEIDVYYVSASDLSVRLPAGSTSNYRAVEVRILRETDGEMRELARARRVYAYVPVLAP